MPENRKNNIFMLIFIFAVAACAFISSSLIGTVINEKTSGTELIVTEPEYEYSDGVYTFGFTLPEDNPGGKYLSFCTFHYSVIVEIDGEKVYELIPEDSEKNMSTGNTWNCVRLKNDDAGKECLLTLTSGYSVSPPDSEIFIGEKYDILAHILKESGMRSLIAIVIMLVGVILFVYTLALSNFTEDYKTLFFSMYCIALSTWAISGSSVSALFIRNGTLLTNLEHFSLALMPVLFTLFLRETYRNRKNVLWKVVLYSGVAVTAARFILEAADIMDIRATLTATQVHILLTIVLGLVLSIDEVIKNSITTEHLVNYICLGVMFFSALAELVIFRFAHIQGAVGMTCFLIYVVIIGINLVYASRRIKKRAEGAEIYKKLAFTDVLTGTFSRTAFTNDIRKSEEKYKKLHAGQVAVFMFDLNNLKKCNDEFGHENGDRYIKSVSSVITEAVGLDGRCYRMGGDEFSALVEIRNKHQIDSILSTVKQRMDELNSEKFVVNMSVAAGYAVFDRDSDQSIEDTMRRADEMMYENKQKMKNAGH